MALITFLSLASFSDYDEIDVEIPFLDKLVHLIFYSVATVLSCMFIRERSRGKIPLRSALVFSAIFLLIYGTVIEVIQAVYTPDRSGEIMDFAANFLGILFALYLVKKSFSANSRLKWKY